MPKKLINWFNLLVLYFIYFQSIENEMKAREKESEDKLKAAEAEYKSLQKKLEQQVMFRSKTTILYYIGCSIMWSVKRKRDLIKRVSDICIC